MHLPSTELNSSAASVLGSGPVYNCRNKMISRHKPLRLTFYLYEGRRNHSTLTSLVKIDLLQHKGVFQMGSKPALVVAEQPQETSTVREPTKRVPLSFPVTLSFEPSGD